jgi:quercetin dioxygenase-like cupin family protein
MALEHATFAEVVAAGPLGDRLKEGRSETLVKEAELQISRLVFAQGHELKAHSVNLHLVFQCLEGRLIFQSMGREMTLQAGDLCHIGPGEPHAVKALSDASALLTLFGSHPRPSEPIGETA